mmetsp:Transcript_23754/g.36435  ORF Transcript_23754/g.36435 Transcript_23754/m.36435 type:complete len:101 (+) Transcript_23754:990-1292(+)|eukprot:CAMPEP_0170490122 /NCGR_PEP_ID=MMETSP0208-20121228/8385_1 /TAXON_ID=197538 /ORGANISM="Strombidium inclinatum, Strain S3" /LENGTH=100 /DNA_ID=CAMNT_0010765373 /DNA_START=972 /DNA_END=1274 /DNA_ORIENTATION=-
MAGIALDNSNRIEDSTIIEALVSENLALKKLLKINYDFQSGIEEEVDKQLREEEAQLNKSVIFLGSTHSREEDHRSAHRARSGRMVRISFSPSKPAEEGS